MIASRIIDLVAGAGWLVLVLHALTFVRVWASNRARNRAIDKVVAAGNQARGMPNRQQRRAAAAAAKKGRKP